MGRQHAPEASEKTARPVLNRKLDSVTGALRHVASHIAQQLVIEVAISRLDKKPVKMERVDPAPFLLQKLLCLREHSILNRRDEVVKNR